MDEQELRERRQHFRIIFTEIMMVLAVFSLVGFLTLIVLGYSFNLAEIGGQGEVIERTGLVQMGSIPTGATIDIDGGVPLLLRTNNSRTLPSGEHTITLTRDGFDSWSKTITVHEGLVYRLNYPRLFLTDREVEPLDLFQKSSVLEFASVSPNKEKLLVLTENGLSLVNLNESTPVLKPVEVPETKLTSISSVKWSGNSERLLAKFNGRWAVLAPRAGTSEFLFLDSFEVENPTLDASSSPSETLAGQTSAAPETSAPLSVKKLAFETETGDRLLVLTDSGDLREILLRDKKISEPLLKNVINFDNDGDRLVYLTEKTKSETSETPEPSILSDASEKALELRAYRVGDSETYLIKDSISSSVVFSTMRYFQDSYVFVSDNKQTEILFGSWPTKDSALEPLFSEETFAVSSVKKRAKGMAFELLGEKTAVFDLEAEELVEVAPVEGTNGWLDEFLRYSISSSGELSVRDYDGLNERTLVKSGVSDKLVTISGNNRWLYYFSISPNNPSALTLVREKLL